MNWFNWRGRNDTSVSSSKDVQIVKSDNFQTKIVVSRAKPASGSKEDCVDSTFDERSLGQETNRTGSEKGLLYIRRTLLYATASTCFFAIFVAILAVGVARDFFSAVPTASNGSPKVSSNRTYSEEEEYANRIYEYLSTVAVHGAATYNDPISPESQALAWMQYDDPLRMDPNTAQNQYRISQRFALLTLWFQAEYDWFGENNWLSDDECTWEGVFCTTDVPSEPNRSLGEVVENHRPERDFTEGDRVVSKIYLARNNLQGKLPPNLHLLKYLTSLDLSGNRIVGGIPKSYGSMIWLEELYLHDNLLSQDLSISYTGTSSLKDVNLSNNGLKGTLPGSLYLTTSLTRIQLDHNKFTGRISDSIEKLVNLHTFSAVDNKLSGSIPTLLMNGNLTKLLLGENNLSGEVNLEGIRNFKELVLENNDFSGPLPDLSDSPGMEVLRLGGNYFDNLFFPANYLEMKDMINLGLNNLYLTGEIPDSIGTLTNLEILNLEGNSLNGIIPISLMDVSTLRDLTLHNNDLSGPFPFEFSYLTNLERLTLSSNELQSNVPVAIGRLTSLKTLKMASNSLTGQILTSVASLSNLEFLDLGNNEFTGSIPDAFWRLTSLQTLNLAINYFAGRISGSIGNLEQLQVLNVASNTFRGRIPESITSLTLLTVLDLSFNFLGGQIPNNIGDLVNLRRLLLGTNYDETNEFFGLDGTIPASIAHMLKLEQLELNRNRISGFLPSQHKFLKLVRIYDVSDNQKLGGTIPRDFTNMTRLNGLRIFGTNIDGIVPNSFCNGNVTVQVDCVGPTTITCSCCIC